MAANAKPKSHKYWSVVLIVVAAVLLFLAQSAFWVNHTVFDQANFSSITTTALLSQSSRDAIATTVVDTSLQNRPLIKKTVGDSATSLISGLLGSNLSNQAVTELTTKTYAYTTSSDRKDISIDLTGIKAPIQQIIGVAQDKGVNLPSAPAQYQIPDQITLVKSSSFPNLSGVVKLMLWLGPLLWLSSIVLFGLYIYIGRAEYAKRVYKVGGAVAAVAVFGLLASPFIPAPIAAAIPNIDLRPVVENLTTGFLAPFQSQMYWMLGAAVFVLLVFSQRFKLLGLVKNLDTKFGSSKPASKKRS